MPDNHYNPNQPRNAEGEWTDAGGAIQRAASDRKEKLIVTKEMEDKILDDILSRTHFDTFKKAYEKYNVQAIYENQKNYLLAKYFNGNSLEYSVTMARIFKPFTTNEMEARALSDKIWFFKKYSLSRRNSESVKEYNTLVDKLNTLVAPHEDLRKRFIKINK